MNKRRSIAGIALAALMALSVPAFAVSVITGDSFNSTDKKAVKEEWQVDRYAPDEFYTEDGILYLSIGKNGYSNYRPSDKRTTYYNLQGEKIKTKKPSSTTWTATVKINVNDQWTGDGSGKRRAEFRVDLVDGNGKKLTQTPGIALVKNGPGSPSWEYYNPKSKSGWTTVDKFVNGDKEWEEFVMEDGWQTLLIKSTKGVITYYIGAKKIGSCSMTTRDVYPSYMALNGNNYGTSYWTEWDNCYLYDGAYSAGRLLSSERQKEKEDDLSSKYESKRERWLENYTEYKYTDGSGKVHWYTKKEMLSKNIVSDEDELDNYDSRLKKEMPDSYWDY